MRAAVVLLLVLSGLVGGSVAAAPERKVTPVPDGERRRLRLDRFYEKHVEAQPAQRLRDRRPAGQVAGVAVKEGDRSARLRPGHRVGGHPPGVQLQVVSRADERLLGSGEPPGARLRFGLAQARRVVEHGRHQSGYEAGEHERQSDDEQKGESEGPSHGPLRPSAFEGGESARTPAIQASTFAANMSSGTAPSRNTTSWNSRTSKRSPNSVSALSRSSRI